MLYRAAHRYTVHPNPVQGIYMVGHIVLVKPSQGRHVKKISSYSNSIKGNRLNTSIMTS